MKMGRVLVVWNDSAGSNSARHALEQAGYEVELRADQEVVEAAEGSRPALFLLYADPSENGFELCRRIRQSPLLAGTPVVVLIPSDAEEDRLLALENGADDCVSASCGSRELVARIQAVMRRLPRTRPVESEETADILIDTAAMKLSVRGNEIPTTTLEFRLVDYLAQHRGHVFTRDVLLDAVWGEMQFVTPRSVDACIRRVRNKIEPDRASPTYLKTVRGVGYRFDGVAAWPRANEICTCSACSAGPKRLTLAHAARRGRSLQTGPKASSRAS
jgi:DNA-binding response OmpR family regulator